jgi:hypothetical protein
MITPATFTPGQMTTGITERLDRTHNDRYTTGAATLVTEALRFLAYATGPRASDGLTEPATAYTVTGELGIAAARLPQLTGQIARWLDRELAAGRLGGDQGRSPADVVARARCYLDAAARHATALQSALSSAQADLGCLHQASGGEVRR